MNGSWAQIIPLVLIVLAFWFLLIRPARRRQQQMGAMQSRVVPGTQVMLSSGIFGTVESVDEDSVHVAIASGVSIRVHRQAIGRVIEPGDQPLSSGRPADEPASQTGTGPTAEPSTGPAAEPSTGPTAEPDRPPRSEPDTSTDPTRRRGPAEPS